MIFPNGFNFLDNTVFKIEEFVMFTNSNNFVKFPLYQFKQTEVNEQNVFIKFLKI